jgi:hypothetical protein
MIRMIENVRYLTLIAYIYAYTSRLASFARSLTFQRSPLHPNPSLLQ